MGIFKRKSGRSKDEESQGSSKRSGLGGSVSNSFSTAASPQSTPREATLESVPSLIKDLEDTADTSGDFTAQTLRVLFALSDQSASTDNRTKMVRIADARLVPVLLDVLRRCQRGSSEQYLVLLVLNNVSIPPENKRLIAIDSGGAEVIAKLLCEDPSCHLMAIILVNLTFADSDVRRELADPEEGTQLIESLCYALRVSLLTQDEYEARYPLEVGDEDGAFSPKDLLEALMGKDHRMGPGGGGLGSGSPDATPSMNHAVDHMIDASRQLYPETSRWCLSALKNLTRPEKDCRAGAVLIDCGIVPLVLEFVTVGTISTENIGTNQGSQSSSSDTPTPADPVPNSPASWHSNSTQDAALFVVMNLAASLEICEHMKELGAVHILASVADYSDSEIEKTPQTDLQKIKARMALAYLEGSSGHFGQPRRKNGGSAQVSSDSDSSVILISKNEAEMMLEILANTIANRPQEGHGGYSAATFNLKGVMYAIRCLLTNTMNQLTFVNITGSRLNALLMRILAEHAIGDSGNIDADTAEHAAFSLYLQSNYGFKSKFLPALYGSTDKLFAKVLTSYIHKANITTAGRHAADQLLLRSKYLNFNGIAKELVAVVAESSLVEEDFHLSREIILAAKSIIVEKRGHGAVPRDDIFDRPVLRSRAPKQSRAPWDNSSSSVRVYHSAMHAVQALSFESTKVRHMEAIDDILIANNIGASASGEKTESYNYLWSWQDSGGEIQKNLEHQKSNDSMSILSKMSAVKNTDESGPMSIFGFNCGSLCAVDTSVPMH